MTDEKKFARAKAIATLECMAIDLTGALAGLAKTNPMADVLEQRIEAIDTAQAALMEQPCWISVEKKLPEPFVSVLVYMPGERPLPTVHEGYFVRDANKWYSHFFDRGLEEVTHWMPLPEAPEVEA